MHLRIGPTRRHLVREDGSAFFYLADTAWELFHRLTREEAEEYLDVRAGQGFTAIQAVALAELDGVKVPNAYGETAVVKGRLDRPNEAYFEHVEWVVARAAERGLVMAVLPAWGSYVNPKWNPPTAATSVFSVESGRAYCTYLAKRLKGYPVIWVMGGDRPVETAEHRAVWGAMAAAIKSLCPHQLMTFHPMGQASSSKVFHSEGWLDFNMIQSGHAMRDLPTEQMVLADLAMQPAKPTVEAEINYEDHPVWWQPEKHGWFSDYDVRKSAYRAVLSGAAGYTYGCHNVWQMYAPPHQPVAWARKTWRESLRLPGAEQMRHVRAMVEAMPWATMRPDPSFAMCYHERERGMRAVAMSTPGMEHTLLYCPRANALDLPTVKEHSYRTYRWRVMDCRSGVWTDWTGLTKQSPVVFPREGEEDDFVVHLATEETEAFQKHWG